MTGKTTRIYVYTLIDVYSRWTYAWAVDRISTRKSIEFLRRAQGVAPFSFRCVQSDNGPEFSQHFTERIKILHRPKVRTFNLALPGYLEYYNTERLHMGIQFKTPTALIS